MQKKVFFVSASIIGLVYAFFLMILPYGEGDEIGILYVGFSEVPGTASLDMSEFSPLPRFIPCPPQVSVTLPIDEEEWTNENMMLEPSFLSSRSIKETFGTKESRVASFAELFLGRNEDLIETFKVGRRRFAYGVYGPLTGRELVSLKLPENLSVTSPNMFVEIRMWVDWKGNVVHAVLERSSGTKMFDKTMISFVKKWKFAPLYVAKKERYQWGTVRICVE